MPGTTLLQAYACTHGTRLGTREGLVARLPSTSNGCWYRLHTDDTHNILARVASRDVVIMNSKTNGQDRVQGGVRQQIASGGAQQLQGQQGHMLVVCISGSHPKAKLGGTRARAYGGCRSARRGCNIA